MVKGDSELREVARTTWASRYAIETEAATRFEVLAGRLRDSGAPGKLVNMAGTASADEARHAHYCGNVVQSLGGSKPSSSSELVEYAPAGIPGQERLLYEVVAQSCIAETESMTTLVTLMDALREHSLRPVIQELARDEVRHAQLGWAYLSWVRSRGMDVTFLANFIPAMMEGCAGPTLLARTGSTADAPELFRYAVIPDSRRLSLYVETLVSVVLPGFEAHGIDTAPARAWLQAKGLLCSEATDGLRYGPSFS
jgi:hypothetical protein